jgi:hypothetical protein
MRTHRVLTILRVAVAIAVPVGLLAACGAETVPSSSRAAPSPVTGAAPGQVALLSTETGITAVAAGTTRTQWSENGAVSALDGSAVFARGAGTLVRLDPHTGDELASFPIDAALNPVVVAPDARWVALTDRDAYSSDDPAPGETTIVVVDGISGTQKARFVFSGNVEPEAFSTGGDMLVVLDHRVLGYRVQLLDLATGERYDTSDENKNSIGDMTGHRIRGVLSEDRTLLASLYQNPDDPEVPAFVHVLDLSGFAYCVNLPAPFGQSDDGDVLIERNGDIVIVISVHADQRAEFSLSELRRVGSTNLRVAITEGAGERADAAYLDVPGFRALIATL